MKVFKNYFFSFAAVNQSKFYMDDGPEYFIVLTFDVEG